MKRLNFKGILLFAILIGIVIGALLILVFPKKEKTPPKEKKQEISYLEKVETELKDQVDSSFLEWINEEYPESLKKINELSVIMFVLIRTIIIQLNSILLI